MSITPGSRVGPYEVTSQLGEGGMGVVFRGRDSRLQRDVALKVLPDHFATDPDRLSRFEREAQVLASLNHSNIAQIYGLEQVEGATCIVMELVEGETLADRLQKGPLSFDDALDISRQIAEALAAAHERGIVHRDLKPANIKLMPSGKVKVLDFGLAKALGPKTSETTISMVPTRATGGSIVGAVVGTPGYMSPEQARGKEVDARTDIWAFGCVLYEMLTGRQAFEGETVTDIVAKIVTAPPDLERLPPNTPPAVRTLLTCLLNKNATQRLQHIGDTRLFLDGTLVPAEVSKPDVSSGGRGIRRKLTTAALVAAVVLMAIPAVLYFRRSPESASKMRFELTLPGILGQPSISPDGRTIAYVTQPQDGRRMLWLRAIDSDNAQQVPGSEDVNAALWSSDSRRILLVADGRLAKIEVASGNRQVLGQVGTVRGVGWNDAGTLLLARNADNVISRMSDNGGEITPITKLNPERKEILHAVPVFLPDGNHFVYVAQGERVEQDSSLYIASLDPNEPPTRLAQIHPNRFNGMAYVSGYLLILNTGRVTAQRLDPGARSLQGEAMVLAEEVEGAFSVSETGLMIYRKAVPQAGRQLLWFDGNGKPAGQLGTIANYGNVDLSPNGDRAAVDIQGSTGRDIWVIDVERSIPARISFDAGPDWTASWSPDGSKLAYASNRTDKNRIFQKSSTGAGSETELPTDAAAIPIHWSPDNRYIVYGQSRSNGGYDTWLKPLFGDGKPIPYLESPFDKMQVRVSPDSNYVAYATNESGAYQIVVQTFPDASGGKWPISAAGGVEPKWRRDGRELYYLALDGKLMSVAISGPGFKAGRPRELFQTPIVLNRAQPGRDRRYDVHPDGRFLIVTPAVAPTSLPLTVVVNWNAGLEK